MFDMIRLVCGIPEAYNEYVVLLTCIIVLSLTYFTIDLLINGIFGIFKIKERRK